MPPRARRKYLFVLCRRRVVMGVFLLRDCVVLPQTAGSLTYPGRCSVVRWRRWFTAPVGWFDRRDLEPSGPVKSAWA